MLEIMKEEPLFLVIAGDMMTTLESWMCRRGRVFFLSFIQECGIDRLENSGKRVTAI